MQRRFLRNSFENEAVTNTGAIATIHSRAVNVGCITRGNTDDTWWPNEPIADNKIQIAWKKEGFPKNKTPLNLLSHKARGSPQPLWSTTPTCGWQQS